MTPTHFRVPGLLVSLLALSAFAADPPSSAKREGAKPSIVLVHGAFADGTGWQHVIPLLEKDGYMVTAVQNPLTSIEDDIATTKRVIDAQKGPIILVGHSYGGVVITGAASGNPNVKALVYVAALAPDQNESMTELQKRFPPSMLSTSLVPDSAGFLFIDRNKFHEVFAQDVATEEARIMAATQKPANQQLFTQTLSVAPAWKSIPSYFIVATEDRSINPETERFCAKRMGANVTELQASHVPFISKPREVAAVIHKAATSAPRVQARTPGKR